MSDKTLLRAICMQRDELEEALRGVRDYLKETICTSNTPGADRLVIQSIDQTLSSVFGAANKDKSA